jgi:hypothetical protein
MRLAEWAGARPAHSIAYPLIGALPRNVAPLPELLRLAGEDIGGIPSGAQLDVDLVRFHLAAFNLYLIDEIRIGSERKPP